MDTDILVIVGLFILGVVFLSVVFAFGSKYMALLTAKADELITPAQFATMEKVAYSLVLAAEQMFRIEGTSEEKLEYVMDIISGQFPSVDKVLLRAIVEAAVKQYKDFRREMLND